MGPLFIDGEFLHQSWMVSGYFSTLFHQWIPTVAENQSADVPMLQMFERVSQPAYPYISFQMAMSRLDAAVLADAVRRRCRFGPLTFVVRGDLLGWAETPSLTIQGDAEAPEELAAACDEIARRGRHRHVSLYAEDGRECGELIIGA